MREHDNPLYFSKVQLILKEALKTFQIGNNFCPTKKTTQSFSTPNFATGKVWENLDILFKLQKKPSHRKRGALNLLDEEGFAGDFSIIVMRGPKTIHKHGPGASLTWTQFMISLLLHT